MRKRAEIGSRVGQKGREPDKNAKRRTRERKKKERAKKTRRGRNPGRLREAKILLSLPPREQKKKERSKVRASGPDTDRFSRDTDEEEEGAGRKEDKRIYLPVQARISASSKISAQRENSFNDAYTPYRSFEEILFDHLSAKALKKIL